MVDAGPVPCPGDGSGVCSAWTFASWDANCSTGYSATRTCPGGYTCATSEHLACAAALNAGAGPPAGCLACGVTGTLQYFGYYRDSDISDYVCELQDHANFSMTDDSQAKADEAASYGVANFGLTAPTSGKPAPLGAVIVQDDADAAAFGWCASHPCPDGPIDGWNAIKAQIESSGDAIRAQHPNAHIMINLADGDANGQLDFRQIPGFTWPRGVDWVGLECYTGAANCQANLNVLRPLLPTGARAWVIAAGVSPDYGTEAFLVNDANANYAWSNADPSVIGLIVFVWGKGLLCPPNCASLAVKEMPSLLATCRQLGQTITGRTGPPKPDDQCPAQP
jgi:hypothetical protein